MKQYKHIRTVTTYSRITGQRISEESAPSDKGLSTGDAVEVFAKGFMESVKEQEEQKKAEPLFRASGE